MRRRTHKGQIIDMESLGRKNEKSIAMGNMGVNAKGDKLGPGGKIVQSSQQRTRQHYETPATTAKSVSIKDKIEDETLFPEEAKTKAKAQATVDSNNKSARGAGTTKKTRKTKKPQVEKETETGDIIMVDKEDE